MFWKILNTVSTSVFLRNIEFESKTTTTITAYWLRLNNHLKKVRGQTKAWGNIAHTFWIDKLQSLLLGLAFPLTVTWRLDGHVSLRPDLLPEIVNVGRNLSFSGIHLFKKVVYFPASEESLCLSSHLQPNIFGVWIHMKWDAYFFTKGWTGFRMASTMLMRTELPEDGRQILNGKENQF